MGNFRILSARLVQRAGTIDPLLASWASINSHTDYPVQYKPGTIGFQWLKLSLNLTENDGKSLEVGRHLGGDGCWIAVCNHHKSVTVGGSGGPNPYDTFVFEPTLRLLQGRLEIEFHCLHRITMSKVMFSHTTPIKPDPIAFKKVLVRGSHPLPTRYWPFQSVRTHGQLVLA